VPEASLPLYGALGKKSFPVGEEAIVDLSTFTLAGGRMKATRSALNRLREEGFVCRHYEPPVKLGLLQKLELVSDQWLAERGGKEIAFTQGIFNPAILKHQPIFTVEDAEERVYAFLNLVPVSIPGMATYDLIRKVADAPNGVLDMLLCHTFQSLQAQGFQQVNMGLVPMSGMEGVNLTERTIRYAYEHFRSFDRFKGLRKFKEKYNPRWEKRFLVYNHNYHLLQVPAALNRVSHPS
jgi:phosphatidylglycerol lysyltransferase